MTEIARIHSYIARQARAYRSLACMEHRDGDEARARFYRGMARSALADLRMLRSAA